MPSVVFNSVPFSTHLRAENHGSKELIERDRARITSMLSAQTAGSAMSFMGNARTEDSSPSVDVTNNGTFRLEFTV